MLKLSLFLSLSFPIYHHQSFPIVQYIFFLKRSITKSFNLWYENLLVCVSRPNKVSQWKISTSPHLSYLCLHRCVKTLSSMCNTIATSHTSTFWNMYEPYSKEPCQPTLSMCHCTNTWSSKSLRLHSPFFYLNINSSILQTSTHKHKNQWSA